jgi:hypothetical protein
MADATPGPVCLCFRCGKPTPVNEFVAYRGHEDCWVLGFSPASSMESVRDSEGPDSVRVKPVYRLGYRCDDRRGGAGQDAKRHKTNGG